MVIAWYVDAIFICFEMLMLLYLIWNTERGESFAYSARMGFFFLVCMTAGLVICDYLGAPIIIKDIYLLIGGIGYYYYRNRKLLTGIYYTGIYYVCLIVAECFAMWGLNLISGGIADFKVARVYMQAVILSKAFLLTFIGIVKRVIVKWRDSNDSVPWILIIVPNILNMIYQMISAEYIYTYDRYQRENIQAIAFYGMLTASLFILVMTIFYNVFIEYYMNLAARKNEIEKQAIKMLELKRYYEKRVKDEEVIYKLHHDMKNHLLVLASHIKDDASRLYIDEMRARLNQYDKHADTGNVFIDILFHEKLRLADEYGIVVRYYIDSLAEICTSDMELCSVFANIIDNAIEACQKNEEVQQQEIDISVRKVSLYYSIVINNTYEAGRECEKREGRFHGYGLKNVQDVISKYEGVYEVRQDGKYYCVHIMLPVKGGEKNDSQYSNKYSRLYQ